MSEVELSTAVGLICTALATVVAITIFMAIVRGLIYICRPNEILIFAGRKHRLPDGTEVGYRVVRKGWAIRIPLLQKVSRMDMRLFLVEVTVANAYSKGGIPLTVHAIANVKISSDPTLVRNAVERFLGMDPKQIAMVARQTLEGVLREVLSQLTPEEVNEDRLKFAETLRENAKDDFDKLGLELDVLKVQNVSDEQKYLQNLGRARIALMIRDAQNAENEANQKIAEEEAAARQRAESAQKKAEATVLQKRNQLRAELAKMEAQAQARSRTRRRSPPRRRAPRPSRSCSACAPSSSSCGCECDVVLPAEAAREAAEARARGDAAPLVENGKAAAEALRCWPRSGRRPAPAGATCTCCSSCARWWRRRSSAWRSTQIGELSIVDGGDGEAYAAFVANFPAAVARVLDETARAVGMDVRALLARRGGDPVSGAPVVVVVLFAAFVVAIVLSVVIKRLLYVSAPNEALILSGRVRARRPARASATAWCAAAARCACRSFELVDSVDLTNIAIDIEVKSAYSKGGIPLNVHGVANVKLPGEEPLLNNAVERFLGRTRPEIMRVAKETLEGNLRGVLAQLTPEEVNQDKVRFAEKLLEEAEHDLSRMGLVLDTLKIQNVTDDVGYLNSIGRIQGARVRMDAAVAEARARGRRERAAVAQLVRVADRQGRRRPRDRAAGDEQARARRADAPRRP